MKLNKKFFKKEEAPEIKPLGNKNVLKKYITFVKLSFFFITLSFAVFGIYSFFTTYRLQTPIVFQNPIVEIKHEIKSPISKGKNMGKVKIDVKPISVRDAVKIAVIKAFGIDYWDSAESIIKHESNFNPYAINPTSGACGIFQALPCSKLPCYLEDVECQIEWGMSYFKARYGNPSNALAFRLEKGWY